MGRHFDLRTLLVTWIMAPALFVFSTLIIVCFCKVRMPNFSWDTVPVYIHMCNGSGPFNDSTNEYLASFPIVTIEKGQGVNSNNTMPSNYSQQYAENKILDACKAIKAMNESV